MNDICKAILHIAAAILFALMAGTENPVNFWTVWLPLTSVVNVWRSIELFMGGGYVLKALKCDNCGEYYDYNVIATTKVAFCQPDGVVVNEKDICPECMAVIVKTLENRRNIKIQKKTDPFEDDRK